MKAHEPGVPPLAFVQLLNSDALEPDALRVDGPLGPELLEQDERRPGGGPEEGADGWERHDPHATRARALLSGVGRGSARGLSGRRPRGPAG